MRLLETAECCVLFEALESYYLIIKARKFRLGQSHNEVKVTDSVLCRFSPTYFADKGPYSQRYFFFFLSVVMYRCKSGTIKNAECRIIDTFELWCWRRLLRVPWTERRSILKKTDSEHLLKGLLLKLKF